MQMHSVAALLASLTLLAPVGLTDSKLEVKDLIVGTGAEAKAGK